MQARLESAPYVVQLLSIVRWALRPLQHFRKDDAAMKKTTNTTRRSRLWIGKGAPVPKNPSNLTKPPERRAVDLEAMCPEVLEYAGNPPWLTKYSVETIRQPDMPDNQ